MNRQIWMILVVAMAAVSAQATIRTVNQFGTAQYTSVGAAITASSNGDTLLIAPGTYNENIVLNFKILTVIGAGWDLVTMDAGGVQTISLANTVTGTSIEGIDAVSSTNTFLLNSSADSVTIRRCRLRSTTTTLNHAASGRRAFFEDCIISTSNNAIMVSLSSNTNSGWVFRGCVFAFTGGTQSATTIFNGNNGSTLEVTNCTFVSVRQAFNLTGSQPVIAINNVFYDWTGTPTWGTFLPGSVFDYNASDATGPTIPGSFTNHILLGANDPFVIYDEALNYQHGTSDLHLNGGTGGLALTNTGHPLILDVDGSRSDVGAYGGPRPLVDNGIPAFPFVTSLTIPSLIESGDDLNVNSTGRVGPRY